MAEVLMEFRTAQVPLGLLLAILPPLHARDYSVAGCGPTSELLVANSQTVSDGGRIRHGRVSSAAFCGEIRKLRCEVRAGKLRGVERTRPALHVVAGTGVAAVQSILGAKSRLYQGCKYEQLQREQLKEVTVRLALSRVQAKKVYVWHLLLEDSELVFKTFLQDPQAYVIVAGSVSSGYARDVLSVLHTIYKQHTQQSQEQALAFFKTMENQKRLIFDVWG
jgi:sulfite reductase alpha subunit-like flavoprotein